MSASDTDLNSSNLTNDSFVNSLADTVDKLNKFISTNESLTLDDLPKVITSLTALKNLFKELKEIELYDDINILNDLKSTMNGLITVVENKLNNNDFVGAKGIKGDSGTNGIDGSNGIDGTNGTNGVDATNDYNDLINTPVVSDFEKTMITRDFFSFYRLSIGSTPIIHLKTNLPFDRKMVSFSFYGANYSISKIFNTELFGYLDFSVVSMDREVVLDKGYPFYKRSYNHDGFLVLVFDSVASHFAFNIVLYSLHTQYGFDVNDCEVTDILFGTDADNDEFKD